MSFSSILATRSRSLYSHNLAARNHPHMSVKDNGLSRSKSLIDDRHPLECNTGHYRAKFGRITCHDKDVLPLLAGLHSLSRDHHRIDN